MNDDTTFEAIRKAMMNLSSVQLSRIAERAEYVIEQRELTKQKEQPKVIYINCQRSEVLR